MTDTNPDPAEQCGCICFEPDDEDSLTCICGHEEELHGGIPEFPGSSECRYGGDDE